MEKLLLRALLAGKELNVVDTQCVQGAVRSLEFGNLVVLKAADHIADKPLGMHVGNPGIRVARQHRVADRMHQMCFAQPDTAVNKKRIVRGTRVFPDLGSSSPRELIALAFHETLEIKRRV
jgi:hypothetical protein